MRASAEAVSVVYSQYNCETGKGESQDGSERSDRHEIRFSFCGGDPSSRVSQQAITLRKHPFVNHQANRRDLTSSSYPSLSPPWMGLLLPRTMMPSRPLLSSGGIALLPLIYRDALQKKRREKKTNPSHPLTRLREEEGEGRKEAHTQLDIESSL